MILRTLKSIAQSAVVAAVATGYFPTPVAAQSVHICDDWQSQIWNLVEPWEENSRTFAKGAVRVALIDTIEPAAAAYFLAVMYPAPDAQMGERVCQLVGHAPLAGFSGLDFQALRSEYKPNEGLILRVPAMHMTAEGDFSSRRLRVTINQSLPSITAVYE